MKVDSPLDRDRRAAPALQLLSLNLRLTLNRLCMHVHKRLRLIAGYPEAER